MLVQKHSNAVAEPSLGRTLKQELTERFACNSMRKMKLDLI